MGEAGEPFAADAPSAPPPVTVEAAPPAVPSPRIVADPPAMESARGAARRDVLALHTKGRNAKSATVEGVLPSPHKSEQALPAPERAKAADVFVHPAVAAEPGADAERARAAFWRRVLASPYLAWIALVVLIGGPVLGLLRGQFLARREERDLTKFD